MRVFKNKWFTPWTCSENNSDTLLINAAEEITEGKVEADLGGCLFKKRLSRIGGGKRGGYRIIVGFKRSNPERIIFLYAFAKNEKGNVSEREETALSLSAEAFLSANDKQVNELLAEGSIWEVQYNE